MFVKVLGFAAEGGAIAEIRCVLDPPTAPESFADLPASRLLSGWGALVSADGEHSLYAATRDAANTISRVESNSFQLDATAPELSCEVSGPARISIGATAGEVTAIVDDPTSDPETASVSATLIAADLDSLGKRTVAVSGRDLAGNKGTVDYIDTILDGAIQRGCPTYSTATKRFTSSI